MREFILLLLVFLMTACETGTRYDKNTTLTLDEEPHSGLVDRTKQIEHLVNEEDQELAKLENQIYQRVLNEEQVVNRKMTFSGGTLQDGLEVTKIRQGRHEGYIRLVFDVDSQSQSAQRVGKYTVKYNDHADTIEVVLNGYRKFSATLPAFSGSSEIEKMYFSSYLDDSGFKLNIKLKQKSKIRAFDLKQPARLVIDIKAI